MQKAKFIISKKKVFEQYGKVKAVSDIVSYSSKTNQEITKILEKETDSMFSVHLANELKHIADKTRVIFLAQAWSKESIKKLLEEGIRWLVVDNENDLDAFIEFMESYGYKNFGKINLLLRIKLKENTIRTEKYYVFGMNAEAVNKKLRELKDKKYIAKLGIHFHRKTQNMSEWGLKYEINYIIDVDNWKNIDIVNIGGGIPAVYANTNEDVIRTVFDKIKEFREWLNNKKIEMIIEPGRYIAAGAVRLITSIIAVHDDTIIVNASAYNTDLDALIVPVKLLVEGELAKGEGKAYMIKGMTPCSMDLFRYRVYLKEPKAGDKIIFLNAGAYNFSSDFCDLEKLESEAVE